MQLAEPINIAPVNISPVSITHNVTENVLQTTKVSGSDSEAELWSLDRVINEVCRLLPKELCPKTQQEQTPAKPLSGIEHLIESFVQPQPKLVKSTVKCVQNKLAT